MSGADGRWSIKCPAETRTAVLRLAHATDQTVAEWLAAAVEAMNAVKPAPAFAGDLELAPGLLVRHRAGGPVMVVLGLEPGTLSSYPGILPDTPPSGLWLCQWFGKGRACTAAFDPIALEPAP